MSRKVKIGIFQMQSKLMDVQYNIEKAKKMITKLAVSGAQIICLPELFATGYDLASEGHTIIDLSYETYSYVVEEMKKIAKENKVYLISPFGEVNDEFDAIYNAAVFIDDEGNEIGSYRKNHLWDLEKKYFKEGNQFPVFHTKYGNIGILICYDAGFPEPSRIMCVKGAEIVFFPSAWRIDDEDMWDLNLRQRALENIYFTVGVNQFDPSEKTRLFGKSKVCNPRGKVLIELPKNIESSEIFEIDLDEVRQQRKEISYLADRKPNSYAEILN